MVVTGLKCQDTTFLWGQNIQRMHALIGEIPSITSMTRVPTIPKQKRRQKSPTHSNKGTMHSMLRTSQFALRKSGDLISLQKPSNSWRSPYWLSSGQRLYSVTLPRSIGCSTNYPRKCIDCLPAGKKRHDFVWVLFVQCEHQQRLFGVVNKIALFQLRLSPLLSGLLLIW